MQQNNNFDTIISSWRRMSGEQAESVTVSMSGDSQDFQVHKKKDEESSLLVSEKLKGPIATVASAGRVSVAAELPSVTPTTELEEKLLNHDKEDSKEAAGDATNKEESDYLENEKLPERKPEKATDKVDSVFVSPQAPIKPPPEQTGTNSNEDDCIITCLYYTLQCCDCVLM